VQARGLGEKKIPLFLGKAGSPFVIALAADTAKLLQATCRHKLAKTMIALYAFN
jgi:hypothetical protein